jgi:Trk K+ transport system NAD-binding subunit
MVVAELQVDGMLEGQTVADLRDQSGTLVMHLLHADGSVRFDPPGAVRLGRGDRVTVQAALPAYQALRARMERAA